MTQSIQIRFRCCIQMVTKHHTIGTLSQLKKHGAHTIELEDEIPELTVSIDQPSEITIRDFHDGSSSFYFPHKHCEDTTATMKSTQSERAAITHTKRSTCRLEKLQPCNKFFKRRLHDRNVKAPQEPSDSMPGYSRTTSASPYYCMPHMTVHFKSAFQLLYRPTYYTFLTTRCWPNIEDRHMYDSMKHHFSCSDMAKFVYNTVKLCRSCAHHGSHSRHKQKLQLSHPLGHQHSETIAGNHIGKLACSFNEGHHFKSRTRCTYRQDDIDAKMLLVFRPLGATVWHSNGCREKNNWQFVRKFFISLCMSLGLKKLIMSGYRSHKKLPG